MRRCHFVRDILADLGADTDGADREGAEQLPASCSMDDETICGGPEPSEPPPRAAGGICADQRANQGPR
ncbi:hypothetical protein HS99_0006065 [Kitasatospora aureofaciens]|uniref:Uncharacterized protein n=1 Tax=Kitasatospora aureofaciens TaxID=1894 RepID=A0A1E7N9K8_KITAU|nr:hypothetical protein HS99_0006065 [Kitasatospora aureofaciens]GGV00613.1 hypothetical protein GCM10010502_63900 [Kitasatospora aureofaciens]